MKQERVDMDTRDFLEAYAVGRRIFRHVNLSDYQLILIDNQEIIDQFPANLKKANLTNIGLLYSDLSSANLDEANLSGANLMGTNLSKANLTSANLSRVEQIEEEEEIDICGLTKISQKNEVENEKVFINLSYAILRFADLSGANLTGADLSGADLTSASLTGADLSGADLTGANLDGADLDSAILKNANLTSAILCDANLSSSYLSYADLTGVDLTNADLTGADLTNADLTGADLGEAIIFKTKFGNKKVSEDLQRDNQKLEELQQKNQELIDQLQILETQLNSKIKFSKEMIFGYLKVLRAQQADFIQRLKSGYLLHCETKSLHSELIVISGERLKQLRSFCWEMAEKYKRLSPVRDVFINNLKGKLGEEVVKARLSNFINEVDYEKRIGGDGKVDFTLTDNPSVGIQVKTRQGSIDTIQWVISSEEVEKNKVLICILIQEEVNEAQAEYHLYLAGFLPTNIIEVKNGKASVAANELWYGGGLRSYLEEFLH